MHPSYNRLAIALAALAGPPAGHRPERPDPAPATSLADAGPHPAPGRGRQQARTSKTDDSWGFLKGWKGGVEIGLSGSEGNSENFNMHAAANAEPQDRPLLHQGQSFLYLPDLRRRNCHTKNRAELDLGNDWILEKGSPGTTSSRAPHENTTTSRISSTV